MFLIIRRIHLVCIQLYTPCTPLYVIFLNKVLRQHSTFVYIYICINRIYEMFIRRLFTVTVFSVDKTIHQKTIDSNTLIKQCNAAVILQETITSDIVSATYKFGIIDLVISGVTQFAIEWSDVVTAMNELMAFAKHVSNAGCNVVCFSKIDQCNIYLKGKPLSLLLIKAQCCTCSKTNLLTWNRYFIFHHSTSPNS